LPYVRLPTWLDDGLVPLVLGAPGRLHAALGRSLRPVHARVRALRGALRLALHLLRPRAGGPRRASLARAHASTQTTVTLPDASSVHVAPTPHESGCDGAASMHAHVGVEAHDAGTAAHVYVSAGAPPSGGAMPGG